MRSSTASRTDRQDAYKYGSMDQSTAVSNQADRFVEAPEAECSLSHEIRLTEHPLILFITLFIKTRQTHFGEGDPDPTPWPTRQIDLIELHFLPGMCIV